MSRLVAPRDYPAAPLCAAARRDLTASTLMALCGFNGKDARHALEHGLTSWQADRAAIRLGMHPSEIWGDLWFVMPLVDELVAREHVRLERWVRSWVTRHHIDPCSRVATPRAARRGHASVGVPAGTA